MQSYKTTINLLAISLALQDRNRRLVGRADICCFEGMYENVVQCASKAAENISYLFYLYPKDVHHFAHTMMNFHVG